MALPQITLVDSAVKLNQIIYEADESLQNDKVLAYLNQVGLINYNDEKECVNGHLMELKKSKELMAGGGVVDKKVAKNPRSFEKEHSSTMAKLKSGSFC